MRCETQTQASFRSSRAQNRRSVGSRLAARPGRFTTRGADGALAEPYGRQIRGLALVCSSRRSASATTTFAWPRDRGPPIYRAARTACPRPSSARVTQPDDWPVRVLSLPGGWLHASRLWSCGWLRRAQVGPGVTISAVGERN